MKKLIIILLCFVCVMAKAQQVNVPYNPSRHVVVNDAISPAQATPIDGRMMYYDTTNFVWRAFKDTAEVRLVLNASKYRFGNSIIVVDSGGTLQSNGTFLNQHNTFWSYRDSTTNSALVKMWLFADAPLQYTASAPVHITGTNISVDTSTILATKYWVGSQGFITNINGLIQAGTNITITGSGSSISPYVINSGAGSGTLTSVGLTMPAAFTVGNSPLTGAGGTINVTANGTASQYIQGNGVLNTFPALFNPIAGLGITLSGTYPNITFAVDTSQRLDTVFAKYPLYVPPGTPDSVAIYLASAHQQGALDSLDWVIFNNKQRAIQFSLGTSGQIDSLVLGTNLTATLAGNTYTLNANNSSTNNIKWLDTGNHVIAGIGVGTVYKADTGIRVTLSGDTIKLKIIPDTLYLKYTGLSGVGYDSTLWVGGSTDTFYSPRLHDSTGIQHGYDVNGNLYFMATGAVPTANNGDTLISGNIGLGGSLLRNTTIHGAFHNFLMDSLGNFNAITNNIFSGSRNILQASPNSTLLETQSGGAGDTTALISTFRSAGNYIAVMTAALGNSVSIKIPQIELLSADSSTLIQGAHITIKTDTTLASDFIKINELPFTSSTSNMTAVGWNTSTGQIFSIPLGSGGGGGNTNSNIGSGFRFAVPSTNNIKTLFCSGCTLDSTTNTNALTLTVGGSSFTRQVITSGTSATGSATANTLLVTFDPASLLSAFSFTMIASPSDGQVVKINFGGTLTSGSIVPLTVLPNSGQTIIDNTPPSGATMTPDNYLEYQYRSSTSQWYRLKP